MEKEIKIPDGVDVEIHGKKILVRGPKGELTRDFSDPRFDERIDLKKNDNIIIIKSNSDRRKIKAMVGTISSHINNMMIGVTKGFRYKMKIFYAHFPMSIEVKDDKILIRNFLGEKGARIAKIVGNTKVDVKKDEITLTSINKEDAAQTSANIERACKLSRRDRRIFSDGIFITGWEICD